jgi:hypothetical protein
MHLRQLQVDRKAEPHQHDAGSSWIPGVCTAAHPSCVLDEQRPAAMNALSATVGPAAGSC